jgi:LemA protein
VLIARPLGFTEGPFYQDEDPAIQSAPQVSFANPAA